MFLLKPQRVGIVFGKSMDLGVQGNWSNTVNTFGVAILRGILYDFSDKTGIVLPTLQGCCESWT